MEGKSHSLPLAQPPALQPFLCAPTPLSAPRLQPNEAGSISHCPRQRQHRGQAGAEASQLPSAANLTLAPPFQILSPHLGMPGGMPKQPPSLASVTAAHPCQTLSSHLELAGGTPSLASLTLAPPLQILSPHQGMPGGIPSHQPNVAGLIAALPRRILSPHPKLPGGQPSLLTSVARSEELGGVHSGGQGRPVGWRCWRMPGRYWSSRVRCEGGARERSNDKAGAGTGAGPV